MNWRYHITTSARNKTGTYKVLRLSWILSPMDHLLSLRNKAFVPKAYPTGASPFYMDHPRNATGRKVKTFTSNCPSSSLTLPRMTISFVISKQESGFRGTHPRTWGLLVAHSLLVKNSGSSNPWMAWVCPVCSINSFAHGGKQKINLWGKIHCYHTSPSQNYP